MKTSMKIVAVAVAVVAIASGGYIALTHHNSGTLNVYVQDLPANNVSAVYITFSAVSVHGNNTGWANYSLGSRTIDILGLTASNATLLNSITLNAEKYTMIRLYISKVNVTVNGQNVTFSLKAPFAFINHPFNVSSNSSTAINFDFKINQDLNMNSRIFTPNIGYTVS